MKKLLALVLAMATCLCLVIPSYAAEWPTDTVTVYVPAASGSALDLLCRIETDYLTRMTGKNFVVIDDETGNGTVAYETVRHARPDGNTLLYTQNIFIQYYGNVYNEYALDVLDAIASGGEATSGYAIAIAAGRPYKTWDELVAYAKEHPGEVICGIQNGGMAHLLSALICKAAGIEVRMVESGGSTEKITNMMGGRVDFAMIAGATAVPYEESGDIIVVGQTTLERPEQFPNWPTTVEMGYPDVQVLTYINWYAPKGLDEDLKLAINESLKNIQEDEIAAKAMYDLGYYYRYLTIDEDVELLLQYADNLKAGYELAGVSMEGKK